MPILQEVLRDKVEIHRKRIKDLLDDHGDVVVSQVTIRQLLGGARGVRMMLCDTSTVDPDRGLFVRDRPIGDLTHLYPEEMFFLLLTGELPDEEARRALQRELDRRSQVPQYVWQALQALPEDSTPMAMLNTAVLMMDRESVFRKWYHAGMKREEYWLAMLEDSLNILAKLPVIAAGIYRLLHKHGTPMHWTTGLDYAGNFANMLGVADPAGHFAELIRLILTLHVDHEGGNVSANTTLTVGSSLSDAYYAVSAGLNGLAGPLHGLANQECIAWILEIMERHHGVPPTKEELRAYALRTLRDGLVIPGYGHAVLRCVDPRFTALHEFALRYLHDDPIHQTVDRVYEVVPQVLREYSEERVRAGKSPVANIWPNVDAISGSLVYHFGITEFHYYTVLFAVSRTMGLLAQLVLNRALLMPLMRPKSVATDWLEEKARAAQSKNG
jgi:citrate synthase